MDSYKTIAGSSTGEYKEKGSKFIGYAIPVSLEEEVKQEVLNIRQQHPKARHHCYAYRLGYDGTRFRTNDDGEPSGTAGKPILSRIDAAGVTNTLLVVVRYFGGVLLGTAGLTKAYKQSAQAALVNAKVIEKEICDLYNIHFTFSQLPEVMNMIKSMKLETENKTIEEECNFTVLVPKARANEFKQRVKLLQIEIRKAG